MDLFISLHGKLNLLKDEYSMFPSIKIKAILCATAFAIAMSLETSSVLAAGGEMNLETQGIFWAGGEIANRTQKHLTKNKILRDQLYVEYFIPKTLRPNAAPIVLTHTVISGVIWRTTPDGREGWAEYLVRQGFPVFVIDPPGTGRSGFEIDDINTVATGDSQPMANAPLARSDSSAWPRWNLGLSLAAGTQEEDQTPTDEASTRHLLASLLPSRSIPVAKSHAAFIAALEKINEMQGPVIFVGWSLAGGLGQRLVVDRPDLFSALILLEGASGQPPLPTPENWFDYCSVKPSEPLVATLVKTGLPVLSLNGQKGHVVNTGHASGVCKSLVDDVNAGGGHASSIWLPDLGIRGNGHMMFWDKNSDQIVKVITDWIDRADIKKSK